ncbi:MAG: CHAD domain-containing protein, partial [Solirubrobacteraceae bacterium]
LRENAAAVVRSRVDELCSFGPAAMAGDTRALHDMRIAAKRLRYVLELTGVCFGPYAARAARNARELQDMLGAIHDCDVLAARIEHDARELAASDAQALALAAQTAGEGSAVPRATRAQRHAYAALAALLVDLQARRAVLLVALTRRWRALERTGFQRRLLAALDEAAAPKGA